jgi:glycerophosphoryl diester phosphodiesterase
MVKNCAHRGNWREAPENTLPAIQSAIDLGVDMIEIDVHRTKDGHVVVSHDHDLFRMFGTHGIIKDLTLAEVQTFRDKFLGLPVPQLYEVLDIIKKSNVILNIELKAADIETECIEMVKERQMGHQVVYSSFMAPPLMRLKELDPNSVVCFLSGQFPLNNFKIYLDAAKMVGAAYMNMHYATITPDTFQKVSEAGFKIMAWTVDAPKEMQRLIDLGVDTIITNEPARLQEILKKNKNA